MSKVKELNGPALDWAVASCEGQIFSPLASSKHYYAPSIVWAQGGPIIEKMHCLTLEERHIYGTGESQWKAYVPYQHKYGPTPLVAAMRCYVASKLGEEIEIPEELK